MKTLCTLLAAALTVGLSHTATAAGNSMSSRASVGMRYHQTNPAIAAWPYGDGDLSYGAAYALYEGLGYLEAGLDYTPDGTATPEVEDIWTPRLNIAIKDGIFVAGGGIANSYVNVSSGDSDWIGVLYQFFLGVDVPLSRAMELGAGAYYSFDDWGELGEFDVDCLEYGLHLGYLF